MQIRISTEKKSILREKSLQFSVEVIDLCDRLCTQKHFRLADQILRSGTSIGANIREAGHAESALDFIHKLSISLKECGETLYWLEVLQCSKRISDSEFQTLFESASELKAMLTASINTKKRNNKIQTAQKKQ